MAKRKVRIHEFEIGIYPRRLWVVMGNDYRCVNNYFRNQDGTDILVQDGDDCALATTYTRVAYRDSGMYGVLILFTDKHPSEDVVAHECIHAAMSVFEECGIAVGHDGSTHEHFAYLVGWMVRMITSVIKGNHKSNEERVSVKDVQSSSEEISEQKL